ncbi:MAG: response regulator [Cyanobacteria bacterium REEB65]|nr:response regulator [Cyanobacteria bacterium REEB65]
MLEPSACSIWILEPVPCVWGTLATALEDEGFRVEVFWDVDPLLTEAKAQRPDLLIIDLDRKGENSCVAVCRRLSADPLLKGVRFITIDVPGSPSNCYACLACGAEDYLVKPLDPIEALLRIRNRLRNACHGGISEPRSQSGSISP